MQATRLLKVRPVGLYVHELHPTKYDVGLMWVKQCHKPPMTGNGKDTTYKNGDLGDVPSGKLTVCY